MTVKALSALARRSDLFTLRLFVAAIDEGQIGRAAARLHLAPSAATRRVQELEALAGTPLFERGPRGVVPSAAGEVVARHARTVLAALDAMRDDLDALAQGRVGRVTVAAPRLLIVHVLATRIGAYTRRHPGVELQLREEISPDALAALEAGEADLAVYSRSADTERAALCSLECASDSLLAVMPAAHPLAHAPAVPLTALLAHDLIGIGPRTTVMANLRDAAEAIGCTPRVRYSVASVEAARSLALAGLGVMLQPACMGAPGAADGLIAVPVEGDWARRSYRVAWQAARPLPAAARALVEALVGHALPDVPAAPRPVPSVPTT